MTHIISAIFLTLLLIGRSPSIRVRRKLHSLWMAIVVIGDLTLVGYLVFGPKVLNKVDMDMSGILMVHISFAISLVACYALSVAVGWRLYFQPTAKSRQRMQNLDRLIVPIRIAVFLTGLIL